MDKQVRDSDFVTMVCTESYYHRVMDEEEPGIGRGVLSDKMEVCTKTIAWSPQFPKDRPVN